MVKLSKLTLEWRHACLIPVINNVQETHLLKLHVGLLVLTWTLPISLFVLLVTLQNALPGLEYERGRIFSKLCAI